MRFMRDHRPREKVTCPLSPSYLAWLDYALGIAKASANDTLDTGDYDFRVLDDPAQLHALIRQKNTSNKARVVAGYCWNWFAWALS